MESLGLSVHGRASAWTPASAISQGQFFFQVRHMPTRTERIKQAVTMTMTSSLPKNVDDTLTLSGRWPIMLADRSLATALYPVPGTQPAALFLEGEAGVGKTEIAKVLSQTRWAAT